MTNPISASGRPARPQSPRAGAALLRTLRLAPLGLLPLLAACGSLTGLDAGSTFNCGKGQGVPCTSVETLSRAHAARTLPHQREEEARAPIPSAAPTQNAPAAGPLTTGEAALPADPTAAVKAAQDEDPRRHYCAVRLDGKAPGSFPRRIPEVITKAVKRFARLNVPVYKGNTIEETAKAAGIPPENLVATVREYNEAVKKGAAAKLNPPYLVASPKPLETAPYYLIPVAGGICSTMGGIAINKKTEVLNNENKVIPGLYAAGASTGGIWYDDDLGGNQLGGCMVFGRIAGRSAAERAQKRV